MNAIVKIPPLPVIQLHGGVPMADSRDVARYYKREHKSVLRSIRDSPCSASFRRRNFAPCISKGLDGRDVTDHVLMTKSGFAFVVLAFTGDAAAAFREDYTNAYDRMEEDLRQEQAAVDLLVALQNPATLIALLGVYANKAQVLETENRAMSTELICATAVIESQEPIVEAYREIAAADGLLCITDAAKAIGVNPSSLFVHMRDTRYPNGWIYGRPGVDEIAYQRRIDRGELQHKVVPVVRSSGTVARTQVMVTPRGLYALQEDIQQRERQRRREAGEFDL